MTQPIFLVGPRGCGKSTVGLELARACQSEFVDTDHWLQTHAGHSIAEIVEKEGWDSFRSRETATLEAVTAPSTIVATGGGIILVDPGTYTTPGDEVGNPIPVGEGWWVLLLLALGYGVIKSPFATRRRVRSEE